MDVRVWLAELELTAPDGTTTSLLVSDVPIRPFTPNDADRPNAKALPVLLEVRGASREAFVDLTRGAGGLGRAELVLANGEHDLTPYRDHTVGAVTLRRGPRGGAWADFTLVIAGSGEDMRFGLSGSRPRRVRISLFDERAVLERSIQPTTFDGTNEGADGYEGTPETLEGQPKPRALGDLTAGQIPAVWANAVRQVIQVNDGAYRDVADIRDRGQSAGLTFAGDSTGSTFDSLSLNTGEYATDTARGYVLLNANLQGPVTLTIKGDASGTGYEDAAPALLRRVLGWMGVPASRIGDSFDRTDLPQWPCGVWIDEDTRARRIGDLLCRSIDAWCLPDRQGVWQIGLLRPPAGSPVTTWREDEDVLSLEDADGELLTPAWKVTVRYARNHAPLSRREVAPALRDSDAAAAEARQTEWSRVTWKDQAVKDAHRDPRELTIDTVLIQRADAEALRDVLATFHGQPRHRRRVRVPIDGALDRELGEEARLIYPSEQIDEGLVVTRLSPASPRRDLVTIEGVG